MGRKQVKAYCFNGRPGCVTQVVNHQTGQVVGIYRAEQAGLIADQPWMVVCEVHGRAASYATLRLAEIHMRRADWCELCQDARVRAAVEPLPVAAAPDGQQRKRLGVGRRPSRLITVTSQQLLTIGKPLYTLSHVIPNICVQ